MSTNSLPEAVDKRKIPLIKGFVARERIEKRLGHSSNVAMDILQRWIFEGRLRAYPVDCPHDFDEPFTDDAKEHIFSYDLVGPISKKSFLPENKGSIDWENISIREEEFTRLLDEITHEAIRGDIDLQPSGITWVDAEYDERLQEAEPEPMQSNDRRFKTAAYEVHKASGMPLEIAEEALIEAVERRKVEAWKPFGLARSKQALRHLPSPVDPDTRINGEQLGFWIKSTFGARGHASQPINVGPPPRECVPFEVARAMAAEASGYDQDAARSWLVDAVLVNKRIPAWRKPTEEHPAWRNLKAGDHPSDLYVMTEALKQAIAYELSPEPVEQLGPEPELGVRCRAWLAEEMRKSPERSRKSKDQWRSEALERFSGLTGRAFDDRAWPAAIEETGAKWGRPGRKSSR